MSIRAIGHEQTINILTGSREIPTNVTARVESMLKQDIPIANMERFGQFVMNLTVESPQNSADIIDANYQSILRLGSCSIEMAWQQAGDIHIPRPRRLHEHNQSVLNTFDRVFAADFTDPRDRLLKPMFALQDGGKAHCVSLAGPRHPRRNRDQAIHNDRVARNLLDPLPADVLTTDEKTVIKLLVQQTAIGTALYKHGEKGLPLGSVVAEAEAALDLLRNQCPAEYRDRFDDYLLVSYLVDAGAHTERARYKDVATGEVRPDVTHEDRFHSYGSETGKSLDRIFSEAPEHTATLKLYQPKHLAVMSRLFPKHYQQ